MGNRGCLHDDQRRLVRQVTSMKRWIICLREYKNRKRVLMSPGQYTELFFLDEATALAAGHRPCAECRRQDFQRFKQAWIEGNSDAGLPLRSSVDLLDAHLDKDRRQKNQGQVTFRAQLSDLPNGAIVTVPDQQKLALWWENRLREWSFAGYGPAISCDPGCEVVVHTPRSTVNALRAGYVPVVHESLLEMAEDAS